MRTYTYLAALVDGGGTVPVDVGIARRLVERGHRVVALAEESMRVEVEAAGAAYLPWEHAVNRTSRRPEDDPYRDWECKTPGQLFQRLIDRAFLGPAPGYAADTMRAIEEHRPDAILTTVFALGAMVAAEASGTPYALPMPNVYPVPVRGYPPFGTGLRPPRTVVGTTMQGLLGAYLMRSFDKAVPRLNHLRSAYDLPPVVHMWDQLDSAAAQLLVTSRAFDFPLDAPPAVRYVGPVLDDPAWTGEWTPPLGDEPLVLVGMSSTFMEQQESLQRVVDALGELTVRGLVTTGPAIDPTSVRPRPNVTVVEAAPHAEVLRHAAAAVNHGGHGSMMKAIAAGVPQVVMPHGRDQKDNAVRAASHGVSVTVRKTASPPRIAAALERVLEDPSYRHNAQRLGEQVRREAESDELLRILEQLPKQRR